MCLLLKCGSVWQHFIVIYQAVSGCLVAEMARSLCRGSNMEAGESADFVWPIRNAIPEAVSTVSPWLRFERCRKPKTYIMMRPHKWQTKIQYHQH